MVRKQGDRSSVHVRRLDRGDVVPTNQIDPRMSLLEADVYPADKWDRHLTNGLLTNVICERTTGELCHIVTTYMAAIAPSIKLT